MARIRSSAATRETAVADAVRAVDFTHLWRQLRAAGWTSKRFSGLSNKWRYSSPSGQSFVGEHAVVTFVIESGLSVDSSDDSGTEADGDSVVDGDIAADETVTASQINTSIMLSANTIEDMFGSNSESDIEGTVSPVNDIADASRVSVGDDSNDTADDIPSVDEEGGLSVEDRESAEDDDRVVVAASDVNVLAADELSEGYESVGSDGSDESDSSGEEAVTRREYPSSADDSEEVTAGMDAAFIQTLGGHLALDAINMEALRAIEWSAPSSEFESGRAEYPGLSCDVASPVRELQDLADSPMLLFFYFVPKSLWIRVANETNRYKKQTVHSRAKRIKANQRKRGVPTPESLKQIIRRLRAEPKYEAHEILHVIGLLVARMLNPMTRRFSRHWGMTEDGALPAGNFGRFMARNRCTSILRDLHFVNNEAPRARGKLWKLRPVVDVLQTRFLSGWSLPSKFSFDEGVLPATSKRNTTRMFMPDKPRRYGTKMFMVCDSISAYCHRFEVYVGKREAGETDQEAFDTKTGAAAVVRNMKIVLGERPQGFRIVVIDRFYTSVALAIQLLTMSIYILGTIQIDRVGYDKRIVERRKTRPRRIERGTFSFSRAIAVPTMLACHWWDRKPVHYLATGPAMTEDTIHRNIKGVGSSTIKCPNLVSDYQRWMGGVDVHDQLCLQSYSIQTAFRFTKYYKSLFMGFLDLALVNAYITYKQTCMIKRRVPKDRGDWYLTLHKQLLQLKPEDFAEPVAQTPSPAARSRKRRRQEGHTHLQFDDWVTVSGVQKRRQRACKVCALLRGERKKSFQTTYYCEDCCQPDAKCFLCPKARRTYAGLPKTCYQIWHEDFESGASIPESLGKRIVLRRVGKVGSRNPTRRELLGNLGNEADSERLHAGEAKETEATV